MSDPGGHPPDSSGCLPDFSHEALAHLRVQIDGFVLHVESFLDNSNEATREQLRDDLLRFRNTLVLLDKGAAVYVAEELICLLEADAEGELNDRAELARVLLLAADQLSDHVALLQQDLSLDNALALLPLVNDSRACRGETLLSDMLVLAAGIHLPAPLTANAQDNNWLDQRADWVSFSSTRHTVLARALLQWWRSTDVADARVLTPLLDELVSFCKARSYLELLVPLFQSASLVVESIASKELADGPALRSLYAQLERHLYRTEFVVSPEDLLPGDLLRNLLYYVAQCESSARYAVELRHRFRLDRVRQASRLTESQITPTIGVGYHLACAIRASISSETQALGGWLSQAPTRVDHPQVVRLKVRLAQLEPVLTLMGAPQALACLQQINADLQSLNDNSLPDAETRMRLAQSLLQLDALLESTARRSVTRKSTSATTPLAAEDVFVSTAIDACLIEARKGLQSVADVLEELLQSGPLPTGRCHALAKQLQLVDQALQILPLPEISPLLGGLNNVLAQLQLSGRGIGCKQPDKNGQHGGVQNEIASLLVSIDYYLGCVMQPQSAASHLLVEAEDSLHRAYDLLEGEAANMPVNSSDADWERSIVHLLPHMDAIGTSLVSYRKERSEAALEALKSSFAGFEKGLESSADSPLRTLASASRAWLLHRTGQGAELADDDLALLDEVHAVIPQLMDQLLGGSESIRGFDDLLESLAERDEADASLNFEDVGGLTLNVDDDLLLDSLDDTDTSNLDQTLQHVFHHECLSHLEALDESVREALQPSADVSQRLPSEQMLRALHTLTGSAQTVHAPQIVAIVQPLQRAALARQRLGQSFDASETRYIGDLVMALRARLDSMITGQAVGASVRAVEQRLGAFLAASIPGVSDGKGSGLAMAANVRSLDDVFVEEADELLARMRELADSPEYGAMEMSQALALLHTLKGSARMAGRVTIAEQAHNLERDIQGLAEFSAQLTILQTGLSQLGGLLSQSVTHRAVERPQREPSADQAQAFAAEPLLVSDSAFDALLDLATDVTVNQARLSDELARLREVYQDIESTAVRFRELPQSHGVRNALEVKEIVADLEAARVVMRSALRQAEREQQQASRASSGLQQSLIRSRLVRVDEIAERLAKTVDDAARVTGRQVGLRIEGGEVTLDRALFRQLQAPLEHLARNAVVHGIEAGDDRERLGKQRVGELLLSASMDGTDLVLQFSDDGRGVARDTISALLQSRGESPLETHQDLQSLLFKSGFSSVEEPSELAGHGLGLSAVQATVEQLGGRVQLATYPELGTQITLRIPQRIVVNQVVLVENEGVLFAIPVNHVDAVRVERTSAVIPERYARAELSALLSQNGPSSNHRMSGSRPSVLVSAGGLAMALGVDRVIGYRELVTQALGPQLASLQRFAGGSVLSDGRQVLILDLNRIMESRDTWPSARVKPARESLRPVALIVDDSVTMRVAAESVLQHCGIASRLTRDGVEALESMSVALPNLILLDLEMPRLDGVGFLKRIREKYAEACPPVIVISSRDDQENRQRLLAMGAVRFLAKPYTQSQLQEAVEAAGLRLPDLTIA